MVEEQFLSSGWLSGWRGPGPCSLLGIREDGDLSDAPQATEADGDSSLEGPGRIALVRVAQISFAWRREVSQRILWVPEVS